MIPTLSGSAENARLFLGPSLFDFNRKVVRLYQSGEEERGVCRYTGLFLALMNAAWRGGGYYLKNMPYLQLSQNASAGEDPLVSPPPLLYTPMGWGLCRFNTLLVFNPFPFLKFDRQSSASPLCGGKPFDKTSAIIGKSLFTMKDRAYKNLRKYCLRGFSGNALREQPAFIENLHRFSETLVEKMLRMGEVEDVLQTVEMLPFQAAVHFVLGEAVDVERLLSAFQSLEPTLKKSLWPFPVPGLPYAVVKRAAAFQYFVKLGQEIKAGRVGSTDFIKQFAEGHEPQEITSLVLFLLEASHATTSMALAASLYCSALHPGKTLEVCEEVAVCPYDPSFDDLRKMKKLNCFINEVLRLYPSIPILWRELNPSHEEVKVDEWELEKDAILLLQLRESMRFCPDGEKFLPERFEKDVPNFCPFSKGSNDCIGREFALLILRIFLFHFFRSAEAFDPSEIAFTAAPLLTMTCPLTIKVREKQ